MPMVLSSDKGDFTPASPERDAAIRKARRRQARVAIMCCILLVLIFLIGGFLTNYIPSESMEPNLSPGDHILTMRAWLAYPLSSNPSRGDIIVFRLPSNQMEQDNGPMYDSGTAEASVAHLPKPSYTILIKRVVGLPGDTVQIRGSVVFVNDKPLKETYRIRPAIDPDSKGYAYAYDEPLKVKTGELFVLGDNRNNSDDGRYWGTLKRDDVIGKYVRVLYNEGKNGPNQLRDEESKP